MAMQQPRQPIVAIAMTFRPLNALPAYGAALTMEFAVGTLSFGIVSAMRLKINGSDAA